MTIESTYSSLGLCL